MLEFVLERGNYWAIIGLMMIGLYIAFSVTNLIKQLVGLGLFQTSIVLFYVSLGRIDGGTAPILFGADYPGKHGGEHGSDHASEHVAEHGAEHAEVLHETGEHVVEHGVEAAHEVAAKASGALENVYSNPLPHVLMLTAIVVGVATLSVGLAIIVRIREAYATVEADEVRAMDLDVAIAEAADDLEEASGAGAA